jgi:hypothetical protein
MSYYRLVNISRILDLFFPPSLTDIVMRYCDDSVLLKRQQISRFRQFKEKWFEFSSLCEKHDIIAKMNYACCPSCGHKQITEDYEEKYSGYVFCHSQEYDFIKDKIKKTRSSSVLVHLNWSSFETDDDDLMDMAKEIQQIAKKVKCELKYENVNTTLFLTIKLNNEESSDDEESDIEYEDDSDEESGVIDIETEEDSDDESEALHVLFND